MISITTMSDAIEGRHGQKIGGRGERGGACPKAFPLFHYQHRQGSRDVLVAVFVDDLHFPFLIVPSNTQVPI